MKDQSFPPEGPLARRRDGAASGRSEAETGSGGVVDVASWVVGLLAAKRSAAAPVLRPDLLASFREAAVSEDAADLRAFLRDLVRQKVSAAALADLYIPALARQLGDDWLEDRASFLQVTVASARLQALLRAIGQDWSADASGRASESSLLLIVPPREQHTLGAMVLLGQLRRLGISVRIALGPTRSELRRLHAGAAFDGILLSVTCSARLADLRDFVAEIREFARPEVPVVVGGMAVGLEPDIGATQGVTAVARTLPEALFACGLAVHDDRARRRA